MNSHLMLLCADCRGSTQHVAQYQDGTKDNRTLAVFQCERCKVKRVLVDAVDYPGSDRSVVFPVAETATLGVPEHIAGLLQEAFVALNGGAWNLAVIGFRSALQAAVRARGGQGKDLRTEIDSLDEIPQSLKDWVHHVRSSANQAAHPEEAAGSMTEQDARELLALTSSIMDYLFVVPARVEARRARLASGG